MTIEYEMQGSWPKSKEDMVEFLLVRHPVYTPASGFSMNAKYALNKLSKDTLFWLVLLVKDMEIRGGAHEQAATL